MTAVLLTAVGCVAVLALDAVGSVAARAIGFPYPWLAPFSLALYAVTGFFAADAAGHLLAGAAAGAALGVVDATAGWRISEALGPELEAQPGRTRRGVAVDVVAIGAFAGLVGGLFA